MWSVHEVIYLFSLKKEMATVISRFLHVVNPRSFRNGYWKISLLLYVFSPRSLRRMVTVNASVVTIHGKPGRLFVVTAVAIWTNRISSYNTVSKFMVNCKQKTSIDFRLYIVIRTFLSYGAYYYHLIMVSCLAHAGIVLTSL